jgi:hypothetical protein
VIDIDHDHCLEQIAEDRVPLRRPSGFDLKAALPDWMIGIDLVSERWLTVLPEEHWPVEFVAGLLSSLDIKA